MGWALQIDGYSCIGYGSMSFAPSITKYRRLCRQTNYYYTCKCQTWNSFIRGTFVQFLI